MTPLEALHLLEEATSHLTANRETHIKIMDACKIIGNALMDAAVTQKIAAQSAAVSTDG